MYEFKFDNQENYNGIEKDIKNYNIKNNTPTIAKIAISSVFGAILASVATLLNTSGINPIISISAGVITGAVLSSTIIELTTKAINTSKKNKAKSHLELIANSCEKNNIKTNSNNLSESIIIKQTNKELKETTDEGKITSKELVINDNYYLFLDNNEELCGILERNTVTKNNEESFDNTSYYLLENNDINKLENRVVKVKKLTKKQKDN